MKVIGFNFTKVLAHRKPKVNANGRINQNIEFLEIEKDAVPALKDADIMRLTFKYDLTYEPEEAGISFEGMLFIQTTSDKIKEITTAWKKKKLEKDELRIPLFNMIITRCHLKALNLEEQLGLPLHAQVPRLQKKIQ